VRRSAGRLWVYFNLQRYVPIVKVALLCRTCHDRPIDRSLTGHLLRCGRVALR
jgi:hypothetical protein